MSAEQKEVLTFVVKMLKSQARQIGEIMAELTAVSVAVSGLDPTFSEVLASKREMVNQELSSLNELLKDQYDGLLRSIENGEIF